jgi:pantothenate kinase
MRGLDLLLTFMDVLGSSCDQSLLTLFSDCINFGPFPEAQTPKLKTWYIDRFQSSNSLL